MAPAVKVESELTSLSLIAVVVGSPVKSERHKSALSSVAANQINAWRPSVDAGAHEHV